MITNPVVEATPVEAKKLVDDGWFVLDVRTGLQWKEGRIPGATHMPLSVVVGGVGSRAVEPVLVVTATGGKGWRVAQYLRHQGLEVANLSGGMFAWEAAGLPIER